MNTNTSIIEQSKRARFPRKYLIGFSLIILGGIGWYFWRNYSEQPIVEETVYDTVKKGNIKNSIEESGKIISPDISNLSFLVNGTLDEVYVKEGDKVKKGDRLARLKRDEYLLDLEDAENALKIIEANIKSKNAQNIELEVITNENDLLVQQDEMSIQRSSLAQSLEQVLDLGVIVIDTAFPKIDEALFAADEILGIDQDFPVYGTIPSAFNNSILLGKVKNMYEKLARAKLNLETDYEKFSRNLVQENILQMLIKTKVLTDEMQELLTLMQDLLNTAVPSASIQTSTIKTVKNSIDSALSKMQTESNSLNSSKQKIDNAVLALNNGIRNLENTLKSKELKLETTKLSYNQKVIEKEVALENLYVQLNQAQVKIDRVKYDLNLTTLFAPMDGEIVAVNGIAGETVKSESSGSENALIRILSDASFTTEVYIEETDIAKISLGQKTIITFDAFEDVEIEGEVIYISSLSTIDNNDVTTYLVRVEVKNTQDLPIKEGMSTYVEFITDEALDVLVVPSKAIKNNIVFLADGTRQKVEVGITDGENTEIKSGLTEGQKIIISGGGTTSNTKKKFDPNGEMTSEQINKIGERMKEMNLLPENWDSMSDSEKQKILKEKMTEMRAQNGGNSEGMKMPRGMGGGGAKPK